MYLKMVPLHRIELQTTDYKTVVIPFNYQGNTLYIWLRSLDSNQASWINSPLPSPRLLDRNKTGCGGWTRTIVFQGMNLAVCL